MAKKEKAQQETGQSLASMLENVRTLTKTNRSKEAIAYLYVIYSKLATKKWGVAKKPAQSIREYAIFLVKQYGHNPTNIYPFISQVESIIYGGKKPSQDNFDETVAMFSKLFTEITGGSLPKF